MPRHQHSFPWFSIPVLQPHPQMRLRNHFPPSHLQAWLQTESEHHPWGGLFRRSKKENNSSKSDSNASGRFKRFTLWRKDSTNSATGGDATAQHKRASKAEPTTPTQVVQPYNFVPVCREDTDASLDVDDRDVTLTNVEAEEEAEETPTKTDMLRERMRRQQIAARYANSNLTRSSARNHLEKKSNVETTV